MTRHVIATGLCVSVALLFSSTAYAAGALKASDVKLQDNALTIGSIEAPSGGWLVVHAMEGGEAGPHIGHVELQSGANENLEVPLDEQVAAGDSVILMIHEDTGEKGTFEFEEGSAEGTDAPAMAGGKPIQTEVTVE
jgi:hypothetical protein